MLVVQTDSSQMLTFLVQNILDYAQIKAGKLRKNLEKVDLKKLVNMVMNIQKMQAQSKGIHLESHF